MKLTLHTDYALRMLMSLAVMTDRLITIEDLAARHQISRNHLMKVTQTLVRLGYVESVRGRAGGIRLARHPGSVRMGAVVRQLEDDTPLVECLGDGPSTCVFAGVCLLTRSLNRSRDAFFSELDTVTLADLVAPKIAIRERLGLVSKRLAAAEI